MLVQHDKVVQNIPYDAKPHRIFFFFFFYSSSFLLPPFDISLLFLHRHPATTTMDGSNGKPAGGRIYFGSLEDVEAKNRQAAAANPVPTATAAAASQPIGTTLDSLSKHSHPTKEIWRLWFSLSNRVALEK
jgi:hypothetical protein